MNAVTAALAVSVLVATSCIGVQRAPATEVHWQRIEVADSLAGVAAATKQALSMQQRVDGIEFIGPYQPLLRLSGVGSGEEWTALTDAGIYPAENGWSLRGDRYCLRWIVDLKLAVSYWAGFEPVVREVLSAAGIPCRLEGGNSCGAFVPRRLVPAAIAALRERGFLEGHGWYYPEPHIEPALFLTSPEHRQAIVVRPVAPGSYRAELATFERNGEGWHPVLAPMTAMIGRGSIIEAHEKREGDGGTPSGVHPIGPAFGYASSITTMLRYRQATGDDWWVDDPASPDYNTWVTGKPACSAEAMRRDDGQYELGAVLGWNTDPIEPGRGSAIFLHVWKGPDEPTSGCVALARDDVAALLRWLDADRSPVLVIVPQ